MTCAFCPAADDLQTCDFPIYDFAPSAYWRLRVGDKVRRINDQTGHPPAEVVMLQAYLGGTAVHMDCLSANPPGWYRPTVEVTLRKANGKLIRRVCRADSPVQVLADRSCGAPACELHRCERGPGATCCQDHWSALGAVAGPTGAQGAPAPEDRADTPITSAPRQPAARRRGKVAK